MNFYFAVVMGNEMMFMEFSQGICGMFIKLQFIVIYCCFFFLLQIDLVPPEVVTAWKHYFTSKFEHLRVVCFTSFPKDENERNKDPSKGTSI